MEGLTALVWKERREVYMLTNMDPPRTEGNFCDNSRTPRWVTRPSAAATNVHRCNQHWPAKSSTQLRCRLWSSRDQRNGTEYKCTGCDVGLWVVGPWFAEYHTRVNL